MTKLQLTITFFLFGLGLHATTHHVGSTQTYVSPNALYNANVVQNGDTIEIDAETYSGQAALAVWQQDDLVIIGVGGRPHLKAAGQYIWGKGIWICAGDNISVDNIEFSEAAVPDNNGAGIRLDGEHLTVRNCYFHHNENGILTNQISTSNLLVEYCEFAYNGAGDGYSHNLYVGHINKLTFQYNYSHHANVGHNLKSRASNNIILYNRIMDEGTGNSSRLMDFSNGGFTLVMGNMLMQGPNAQNNNVLGYGLEGLSNPTSELYVINNTFVNKRATCNFISIKSGTTIADVSNNIFTGIGNVITGTTTTMDNNYINTTIANIDFVDEPNYDYNLNMGSPAIDYGIAKSPVNGYDLVPDKSYSHPTNFQARTSSAAIDAGAYEYASPLGVELIQFGVELQRYDQSIILDWTTFSEINNNGFEIQKMNKEGAWLKIGWVDGNSNSNQVNKYQFQDKYPINGSNYYRLKQMDYNGAFKYSKMAYLSYNSILGINIFPNPAVHSISFENKENKYEKYRIISVTGRTVQSGEIYSSSINIEDLPIGRYHLSLSSNTSIANTSFVKIK